MIWAVLPEGCIASDPSGCQDSRGFTFDVDESSTWFSRGLYELFLYEENRLGLRGNALYGDDSVTLGVQGDGLPTLTDQVIAGFATKDFYLGQIGLNPRPVNFTTFNDPQPSFLQSLMDMRGIPSRSWAYTAGAYNNIPKVFGSLTLGGYDAARFVPNNLTFDFGPDISQDFLVAIRSITTDVSELPLLPTGIYAPINTLVSHLWLPKEACEAFEQAFGLVWDDESALYLVDDDLHSRLEEQNPTITFRLGPSLNGDSVDIKMPYSSFDLTASHPLVNGSSKYFPLKRAANDSQYNLGRTFLQNAYLIADFERSNFSVSQALLPESSTSQNLVSILPPANLTLISETADESLRGGEIAGIVIGVAATVIGVACFVAWLLRKRRRKERADTDGTEVHRPQLFKRLRKPKLEGDEPTTTRTGKEIEMDAQLTRYELPNTTRHELPSPKPLTELP